MPSSMAHRSPRWCSSPSRATDQSRPTEYMRTLRDACTAHGTMLIMDEVKTGFRVAKGGAQEYYGVHADLTTYAKAMGNGYPVAAFGASRRHGRPSSPAVDRRHLPANSSRWRSAGHFEILDETDAVIFFVATGFLGRVFTRFSVQYTFAAPTHVWCALFESVPQSWRDWKQTDALLYTAFCGSLIQRSVMLEPDSREPWFFCEAHRAIDLGWLEDVAMQSMAAALDAHTR